MTDENDERKDSADRSMDSTPSTGPGQDPSIDSGQFLRKLAEERTGAIEDKDTEVILPGEARRLLHELRMHQIELEMQNEELRRTQEALEASRARYFDLYDMAPVGYFTLSEQGVILEANLTAATLLGVPRGALVKQPLTRSIVSEDQDIYYLHRKKLFETGERQVSELRMVRQGGAPFWARLEGTAAQNGKSGAPVCRATVSDITESKRLEAEREKLQSQLAQAQKMESVGQLAGGVAHDFNNMVQVITGFAEMALKEFDPPGPLHAYLEQILKAARRSTDLTRQLLAFACRQIVAPEVLDLNDAVGRMLKILRRLIGEDIDLSWTPGAGLWPVRIDPSQVDQILANLCVNARDAIDGVGKVMIGTENVTFDEAYCAAHAGFVPGDYVMLLVNDDGRGIEKDVLEHLFEPFFTTKEVGRGTGLGLATVYGIVRQNGGFINVYSEPGLGTTFRIYLPRFIGEAVETRAVSSAEAAETPKGRGETMLLVEDDPDVLAPVMAMLRQLDYTVIPAATPGEAIRQTEAHAGEIHLLITDMVMPGMNGRELAGRLATRHPGLKTLFMSGYTADIIARRGMLEEGIHFIRKPFSIKELAIKVRNALGVSP